MPFCIGSNFAQNHSVSKGFWDNQHFLFLTKLKTVCEIWEIWHFSETIYQRSLISKWSKISLNCPIHYGFWDKRHFQFSPKFKMGDKILEIELFFTGTTSKVSSTQRVQTLLEITLSLRVFQINDIFTFCHKSRWQPKFRNFNIFQRHYM